MDALEKEMHSYVYMNEDSSKYANTYRFNEIQIHYFINLFNRKIIIFK